MKTLLKKVKYDPAILKTSKLSTEIICSSTQTRETIPLKPGRFADFRSTCKMSVPHLTDVKHLHVFILALRLNLNILRL